MFHLALLLLPAADRAGTAHRMGKHIGLYNMSFKTEFASNFTQCVSFGPITAPEQECFEENRENDTCAERIYNSGNGEIVFKYCAISVGRIV